MLLPRTHFSVLTRPDRKLAADLSEELWAGLENYLLDHGAIYDGNWSSSPIRSRLSPTRPYCRVQIPLRFFRAAVLLDASGPAATGYLPDIVRDR